MPNLYPNVPFADGGDFLPGHADLAMQAPIFDGQTQYLGHRGKLLDSELDDSATAIKGRVSSIEDAFRVTPVSALTVNVKAGSLILPDGITKVNKATENIVVADNTVTYIWHDNTGVLRASAMPGIIQSVLAKVTAVGGAVTAIDDHRQVQYKTASPEPRLIKVFGGVSTNDKVCTQGEVLSGVIFCRDFTVPSGISVTFEPYLKIYCRNAYIDGTITGVKGSQGGSAPSDVYTAGSYKGDEAKGEGGGTTTAGGTKYHFLIQPYGSGGAVGVWGTDGTITVDPGDGGYGGAGIHIEAARDITMNGSILLKGGNGLESTMTNGNNAVVAGSGGGAGGTCVFIALGKVRMGASAVIDCRGGNGANGLGQYANILAKGGGGGGGGQIWVFCQDVATSTAQLLVTPGSPGGDGAGSGAGGGYGGAGGGANGGNGGASHSSGTVGIFNIVAEIPIGI